MTDFDFDTENTENIDTVKTGAAKTGTAKINTENIGNNSECVESNIDNFSAENLNIYNPSDNILKQIDKKIVLKFMKEVKTSRTYIFGLDDYIRTKEDRDDFLKNLKKSLGTSIIERHDNNQNVYGFAGDHVKKIYECIVKKKICPVREIIK